MFHSGEDDRQTSTSRTGEDRRRPVGRRQDPCPDCARLAGELRRAQAELSALRLALEKHTAPPAVAPDPAVARLSALSQGERDVVRLISTEHLTNGQIACRLHVTVKAVEHRVARALRKAGARRRTELATLAVRAGIGADRSADLE